MPRPTSLVVKKGSKMRSSTLELAALGVDPDPLGALRGQLVERVASVGEQVEQHLLELGLVGERRGQIVRDVDQQLDAVLAQLLAQEHHHAVDGHPGLPSGFHRP